MLSLIRTVSRRLTPAVLFATNKGIMHMSGSTMQCLSQILNAEDLFFISDLPKSDALISYYNRKAGENEQAALADIILFPFYDFLTGLSDDV